MDAQGYSRESERPEYVRRRAEFEENEDDTLSASDSGYSNNRRRPRRDSSSTRWCHPVQTQVDLAELRRRQNGEMEHPSHEPSIIWHAKFFHAQGAHNDLKNPSFVFVDDRPLDLSANTTPIQPHPDAVAWKGGPVITIEVFVETDLMPHKVPEIVKDPQTDHLALKRVSRRHLVLNSPFLAKGLREVVQYDPSFHSPTKITGIPEPYAVLFHHFDAIKARTGSPVSGTKCMSPHDDNQEESDLVKKHMQILLEFLRPIREERIVKCEDHLSESNPRVAFDMIWYLLRPGMDVYIHIDGSPQAAVIRDVRCGKSPLSTVWRPETSDQWLITLWRLETDGSRIRRSPITACITFYTGLREVKALAVCPCDIWDAHDSGERRKDILRRSETLFKSLRQGNLLVDYNGPIKGSNQYVCPPLAKG